MPRFFSVARIQSAIDHLSNFETKWVVVPWVLAMNGVSRQPVNIQGVGQAGSTKLERQFFNGSLIGLPPFPDGTNLIRPKFSELTPQSPGDYIVHQNTHMWGNVFSRAGYREMRDRGYLGGTKSTFFLNDSFPGQLQTNLNGFRYEEFLVWLNAFTQGGFNAQSWRDLDTEFRNQFCSGRAFPQEYFPFFFVARQGQTVPWPQGELLQQRPGNTSFQLSLIPSFSPEQHSSQTIAPSVSGTLRVQVPGRNVIVCGAPGVGKSRYIERLFPDSSRRIRTVFFPDYSYHEFVGSYKPVPSFSKESTENITYAFVPGPFIMSIVRALCDRENTWTLIIEEISRAPAASVFGDMFQLLDRLPSGESEYSITVSEHLSRYLESVVQGWVPAEGLRIPPNLYIYASMNPADQGVQRLDSAFKRRWTWHYLIIDFSVCPYADENIIIDGQNVTWEQLCTAINGLLVSEAFAPEDRLIGPFFLRLDELSNKEQFVGKLLHYLWDDVLRHQDKKILFADADSKTFSDVASAFLDGEIVFSQTVHDALGITGELSAPE